MPVQPAPWGLPFVAFLFLHNNGHFRNNYGNGVRLEFGRFSSTKSRSRPHTWWDRLAVVTRTTICQSQHGCLCLPACSVTPGDDRLQKWKLDWTTGKTMVVNQPCLKGESPSVVNVGNCGVWHVWKSHCLNNILVVVKIKVCPTRSSSCKVHQRSALSTCKKGMSILIKSRRLKRNATKPYWVWRKSEKSQRMTLLCSLNGSCVVMCVMSVGFSRTRCVGNGSSIVSPSQPTCSSIR